MKYFKSFLTIVAFLSTMFPAFSFAATYPATCPAEAQAIVEAVGGCSAVDPNLYSPTYDKCCSVKATSGPRLSSEPTPEIITPPECFGPECETPPIGLYLVVGLLFWGGVIYLIVWLVRKHKKKKELILKEIPTDTDVSKK